MADSTLIGTAFSQPAGGRRKIFWLFICLFLSITVWVDRMDSGTMISWRTFHSGSGVPATGTLRYKLIARYKFHDLNEHQNGNFAVENELNV